MHILFVGFKLLRLAILNTSVNLVVTKYYLFSVPILILGILLLWFIARHSALERDKIRIVSFVYILYM